LGFLFQREAPTIPSALRIQDGEGYKSDGDVEELSCWGNNTFDIVLANIIIVYCK